MLGARAIRGTGQLPPQTGNVPPLPDLRPLASRQRCQVKSVEPRSALPSHELGDSRSPRSIRVGAETSKGETADEMTLGVESVVAHRVGGEETLG